MKVTLNGAPSEMPAGSTIADVVGRLGHKGPSQRGVAVALNGEVVQRKRWAETHVAERDRIEVLAAIQGG
jgi:sulfur carrier protein